MYTFTNPFTGTALGYGGVSPNQQAPGDAISQAIGGTPPAAPLQPAPGSISSAMGGGDTTLQSALATPAPPQQSSQLPAASGMGFSGQAAASSPLPAVQQAAAPVASVTGSAPAPKVEKPRKEPAKPTVTAAVPEGDIRSRSNYNMRYDPRYSGWGTMMGSMNGNSSLSYSQIAPRNRGGMLAGVDPDSVTSGIGSSFG